ncbi:MAG: DUF2183 domain-containing protein [Desulfobacteraceae bacterium]|nr:MAG: DUF2183 domain-containing protein [Desulfobacteraceae bacterium]
MLTFFQVTRPAARRLRRLVHVISRPAKRETGPGGMVIYPYRGYGSRREVFLMGRVFRQQRRSPGSEENLRDDLVGIAQRFFRRGTPGVRLRARLNGSEQLVTSDGEGYFQFHMRLTRPLQASAKSMWHELTVEAQEGPDLVAAHGAILVAPSTARFLVISDIDDTVIFTGVANKLKMLVRLFLQGAQSRVAFPGTAALYAALHRGSTGSEMNPMLYVSRGPWGIYEILDEFFNMHAIPVGPVLFLREWGLSLRRPFPRRARNHKRALIRRMLDFYKNMGCVLIGDSGQHDPEIYARLVREYPGRIKAVYIRNVSHESARVAAIEALAKEIAAQGSQLFLAADSFAMAEQMAQHGLISSHALADVLHERMQQPNGAAFSPTRRVVKSSPE